MKKQLISRIAYALMIVLLALAALPARPAYAAATNTVKAGNWSDATVWSLGHVPLSSEDVTTLNAVVVDINNAVCNSILLHNQVALSFSSSSAVLTVGGNVTIGDGNNNSGGTLDMSGGGILKLGGVLGGTGNKIAYTPGGTIEFNGAGAQTVPSASPFTSFNNLTLSGGGVKTITSVNVNGILSLEGTATTTGTATYGAAATLQYKGSGAQTTGAEFPATFGGTGGVIINNTNGVTLGGAKTITFRLTMTSGTLNMANTNLTVGSLTGSTNLTNSTGTAGARTLTIGSDNTSPAAYSGVISNGTATSVAVTKSGTGTLTLSGTNTYTGVTTINAGVLSVGTIGNGGVAGNLGQATNAATNLVLGGGTLQYTGATDSTDRNYTLTTATTSTIDVVTAGTTLTMSGASTNTTGALTKAGLGTLMLSGANLYTGLTTVSAGTLQYGVNNALSSGAATVNGGTFDIATFNDSVGAVTLINGTITGTTGVLTGTSYAVQNGSVSAILAGAVALTKTTAGTVTMSGVNTFTGATTVNGGTLRAGVATSAFGNCSAVTLANTAGAVLDITGYDNSIGSLTGGGANGGNVILGAATLTIGCNNTSPAAYAGVISGTGGAVTKNGTGTLTLSGANTYTGLTTVSAGTLSAQNATALGTTAGATTVTAGATLNINGVAIGTEALTIDGTGVGGIGALTGTGTASLSGGVTLGATTPTVGGTGTLTLSGVIGASGANTLTKVGSGTLILSGANTYTGLTAISAGVLKLGATGDATNTPLGTTGAGTTVAAGAALDLNGYTLGTAEALTLNGTGISSGGALANSSSTAATYSGAITLGSASSIGTTGNITLGGGISGTQNLTKVGAGTLDLGSGTATLNGLTISAGTLISTSGTLNLAGNFSNNGTFTHNSGTVNFNGGSAQTISGSSATTFNNLTINNSSGISLNGVNATVNGALTLTSGTLGVGTNTLTLNGTVTCGPGSITSNATGTVIYGLSGVQTVCDGTYGNLTLSGSGTKTTSSVTVNGTLSMEGTATASAAPTYGAAATLRYNTATARTAGVEWITPFTATGGVIIASTGTISMDADKVFNASVPLTINSGASLNTGNFQLTFGGNFVNNGGTFTAGSSPIVIANTMTTQSIAGFTTTGLVSMTKTAGTATFQGDVNGGGLTINGTGGTLNLGTGRTHTFTGDWTRTDGTLQGGSSTLKIGGNVSGTGGTFTAGTGTVEWNAAGAQTIADVTYYDLVLSGSGVKEIPAGTAVSDTMWIKGAGGSGNAQVHLADGITINAVNLWLGDDGVPAGNWGGNTCGGSCSVSSTYFTDSTGYVIVGTGSTPVTMNYFYAKGQDSSFTIDWSTGTETGNVGFNLYVEDANGKHKLNNQLIPSTGFTTHVPQDYHFATSGVLLSGTFTFYLEDMDMRGKATQHGPFELGKVYGQRVIGILTDWQQIQAECSQLHVRGKICTLLPR